MNDSLPSRGISGIGAAALAAGLLLAGCSSDSDVPKTMASAPGGGTQVNTDTGSGGSFPDINTVPNQRPTSTIQDLNSAPAGLSGAQSGTQYGAPLVGGPTSSATPPPPPPPPEPALPPIPEDQQSSTAPNEPVAEPAPVEASAPAEPAAEPAPTEVAEATAPEAPVAEEPVAEEPVAEAPAAEEPVAEEPVAEEPATEDTASEQTVPLATPEVVEPQPMEPAPQAEAVAEPAPEPAPAPVPEAPQEVVQQPEQPQPAPIAPAPQTIEPAPQYGVDPLQVAPQVAAAPLSPPTQPVGAPQQAPSNAYGANYAALAPETYGIAFPQPVLPPYLGYNPAQAMYRSPYANPPTNYGGAAPGTPVITSQEPTMPATYASYGQPSYGGEQVGLIFFRDGSSKLSSDDRQVLKQIADLQRANGSMIRVVGHASAHASSLEANQRISEARANSVAQQLMKYGVPSEAIQVSAVGGAQPLYSEDTPNGEAGNRRAEVYLGAY